MTSQLATSILTLLRAGAENARRVCADSRLIRPGDIFLAYPGHSSDGRLHIRDAVARGAAAVLWEREGFEWDTSLQLPNLPVDRLRWMASDIADEAFGRPSEKLWTIGVTGTNGKTSISQWIARAFNALGRRCAVIGTLGTGFPGRLNVSANTTPDAILLQEALAGFLAQGAEAVAMEVSSIGLDQGRVSACRFKVAVLSNLTRDHLDYHHSMEAYAAAKAKLFDAPGLEAAVLNFDDLMGVVQARRLVERKLPVYGYSLIPDNAAAAPAQHMLVAEQLRTTPAGMRFALNFDGQRADMSVGLVGQFNVSNLLAVAASLLASGFEFPAVVEALRELTPPEGRMQTLGGIGEPLVIVDYAHTPDALEQVLHSLRATVSSRGGRLVCVFGCGGDRDPGKRPMMGEVAARLADAAVITSDNPRSEDPQAIVAQIAAAAPQATCIVDRAEAIHRSVLEAGDNDVVLIAGKGHENYQEIKGERHSFSDATHAQAALGEWARGARHQGALT
ncbi:MAG: UDP-N-acetylmuramoyl-L-alanyl-D-glutamate--2,6-diaminopimelate ligase [Candidatus Dactylopiibacterium carminicum]|uniref:UDP-N-acetylmuramoyl-L-alanyl-D-glutamate--2,6-diaminopimelate ligase n=1 Tax=Candidatus Dactylopiibacterium carminicum TaxID=857335 RepID=A0A272EQT1_9RHOO|nr:UDP-N-acetylmuramoyl-L-alanyl-D-glutamate--2,6-diaminopimelate ligase [Candidatus Dactylopiibacterium carminicum]KAF7599279.1 UDP-N-acetylmuramoyl-L-alanyl-D-glutamate--2,6-diaminopimelate ligase [Candidatus Dactylopiibacterium carminicum]PAS92441.1 MAG: UDP-N-acetylmuramoyl-L-alanyl-D-glutamate--2,6-diaminopimelate ligase [Candidatus Dactylopiibacterium carminicum]PAS97171.1 MAG: UDP-N-acetylmuramoyl-L-alanyl-D-glutamate--2,6-diaminopimelate ligase [Candidatus Dactylopiibacterium carminicum]